MRKFLLLHIVLAVMLSGCSTKLAVSPIAGQSSAKLETTQKAYIALAADGRYSDKVYAGTGMQVSRFVSQALAPYVSSSQIDNQIVPLQTSLLNASAAGAKYLFVPVITHWEPRIAAWSGIPTRVNIELTVYDTATEQPVAAKSTSVRGRIATFVSQHAHDLAEEAIKELVKSFY
jgi:hypothetical protein